MFKVCIADDEKFVQRSIAQRVEESGLEFMVSGTVGNGIEALKLYEKERPDVFFVDINMPVVNGLDFIERIRERDRHAKTRFVIVSGYDDFGYMQRAIKLGVVNYIKKPILESEFQDMLWEIYQDLQREGKEGGNREDGIWWMDFIREWRIGKPQNALDAAGKRCGTFLILYGKKIREKEKEIRRQMWAGEEEKIYYICFLNAENVLFLFWPDRQLDTGRMEQLFYLAGQQGAEHFVSYMGEYEDPEWVVEQMENRLNVRFYRPDCIRMTVGDGKKGKPDFHYGAFDAALDGGKKDACLDCLEEIVNQVFSREEYADMLNQVCQSLVIVMANKYTKYNLELPESLRQEFFPFHLSEYENARSLKAQLYRYVEALHEKIAERSSHSELVDNVIAYIEAHYQEEISLADLAGEFFVAPTYLAKRFKEKKNCTVMQFLEKVRLNEAGILLSRTNSSVTEVARMVGYNDSNYFARIFKKAYKITPTEYRNLK